MGLIEKVSRLSLRVESDGFQQWRGICTQSWVSGVCVLCESPTATNSEVAGLCLFMKQSGKWLQEKVASWLIHYFDPAEIPQKLLYSRSKSSHGMQDENTLRLCS